MGAPCPSHLGTWESTNWSLVVLPLNMRVSGPLHSGTWDSTNFGWLFLCSSSTSDDIRCILPIDASRTFFTPAHPELSLHHLQFFSPCFLFGIQVDPRSVRKPPRTNSSAREVCCRPLRRNARTCSPAHQRTAQRH